MGWNSSLISTDILAVHAALVPGGTAGRVLLFGGDEHWGTQAENGSSPAFRKTQLYDIATKSIVSGTIPSPDSDVFCAGHAFLPDGRLLIGGGTSTFPQDDFHDHGLSFGGHRRCWIYNPTENEWVEAREMNFEPGAESGGGRWYPTLTTLANGEVITFFGHPRLDDGRHRNTVAERYNVTTDSWTMLPQMADPSQKPGHEDFPGIRYLMFPRVFQVPDGQLFFASGMPVTSETTYHSTWYDPMTGDYTGANIAEASEYSGWNTTCCILPLLPSDDYRVRLLWTGQAIPKRIDLGADPVQWEQTTERDSLTARRTHGMSVILPTGDICVVNGMDDVGSDGNDVDEVPTREAEIYTPSIDWVAGTYTGTEAWQTKESATQNRNYHSVALLLPDGTVWTAGGNTRGGPGNPDNIVDENDPPLARANKSIEIYEPDYPAGTRPTLSNAPQVVTYGQAFSVQSTGAIQRVALVRFSSVTHAGNYDQRYVGLRFTQDGATLSVTAPPSGGVAPPGYYTLWSVDTSGRPCQQAGIVRLSHLNCEAILDRSTFGEHEVDALLSAASDAVFGNAVYVKMDGFRPAELGNPPTHPTPSLTWADDGTGVPTSRMRLVPRGVALLEDEDASADVVQRVTFVYDVQFGNNTAFGGFTEHRDISLVFQHGPHRCTSNLRLTKQPNPYMLDVDTSQDNKHWLSIDLRVFQVAEGNSPLAGVTQVANQPHDYIQQLLDELNSRAENVSHPFRDISTGQRDSELELARVVNGERIYNYAVARVRYRALSTNAENVQCFFRAFTTATTNMRYDVGRNYRRTGDWPDSKPLLGKTDLGELISIPFFAVPRVNTAGAGGVSMETQPIDSPNRKRIDAGGAAEVTHYFGVWLDINQTTEHFPRLPGGGDGPFTGTSELTRPRAIQTLVNDLHQCLIAEIRYQPGTDDPIPANAGPAQNDRLAQRNLSIKWTDNPGGPDSRTIMQSFDVTPSPPFAGAAPIAIAGGDVAPTPAINRKIQRHGPDELFIRWGNIPRGSEVELFFSDTDVDRILALAGLRVGAPVLRKVDGSTLAVKVSGATWIPIPSRSENIASLVKVTLPPGLQKGQHFTATFAQVSGPLRSVLGAFELSIPIGKAAELRVDAVRQLSVMKHISSTVPLSSRWHPVWARMVVIQAGRVREFGTDPDLVQGNPDGTGEPHKDARDETPGGTPGHYPPGTFDDDDRSDEKLTGRVTKVVYDCHGKFLGFVLDDCHRQHTIRNTDRGIERVVRQSCGECVEVTVYFNKRRVTRIAVRC